MQHASLVAFLRGDLPPEKFGSEIAEEVAACINDCSADGVGHVIVTVGPLTEVSSEHAKRILQAVLDRSLTFEAANYTADALTMSDDFQFTDDAVSEAIFFLGDDSAAPTSSQIRAALARLGSKVC